MSGDTESIVRYCPEGCRKKVEMKLELKDIPKEYPWRGGPKTIPISQYARKHILEEVNKKLESLETNPNPTTEKEES